MENFCEPNMRGLEIKERVSGDDMWAKESAYRRYSKAIDIVYIFQQKFFQLRAEKYMYIYQHK